MGTVEIAWVPPQCLQPHVGMTEAAGAGVVWRCPHSHDWDNSMSGFNLTPVRALQVAWVSHSLVLASKRNLSMKPADSSILLCSLHLAILQHHSNGLPATQTGPATKEGHCPLLLGGGLARTN